VTVTPRQRAALAWAALAAVTAAAFWWVVTIGFLGDDFGYVQRFSQLPLLAWPRLFVREWSGGIWGFPLRELRPIAALAFMIDSRVWHLAPAGYHITNLLLHLGCSGLVMLVTRDLVGGRWLPAVGAGLLFAVHPVHTEPVVWITGRVDLLGTFGFLLAFHALVRYRATMQSAWLPAMWVAYAAGIFAKEFCLTLPLMAVLYEALVPAGRPRTIRATVLPYAGWVAVSLAYYVCRTHAIGPNLGAPALDVLTKDFWRIVAQREWVYVGALVWPIAHWLPTADSQQPEALQWLIRGLALVLLASGIGWWRDRQAGARDIRVSLFFLMVWFLVATLPFVVTYVSARHLYLASAGVSIGLMAAAARIVAHRIAFGAVAAVLVVSCAIELQERGTDWRAAATLSRRVNEAVAATAQRARTGDVLLLDVPEGRRGAWVWAWAVPFALQPPFQSRDVASDMIVLERENAFFHPEAWDQQPSWAQLRRRAAPAWLVAAADTNVDVTFIPEAALTAAVADPDVALGTSGSFGRLVDAIRGAGVRADQRGRTPEP